jgi:hypothetical protein
LVSGRLRRFAWWNPRRIAPALGPVPDSRPSCLPGSSPG